jgi:hypothetical protein
MSASRMGQPKEMHTIPTESALCFAFDAAVRENDDSLEHPSMLTNEFYTGIGMSALKVPLKTNNQRRQLTMTTAPNHTIQVADVRTSLRECFQSYRVDPADSYQLGYLDCALSLWNDDDDKTTKVLDVRTLSRECFRSYCSDPANKYELGYLVCALSLWAEMQRGYENDKTIQADVRTWLRECFRSYGVDPADRYQLGYLDCALECAVWLGTKMQPGYDNNKTIQVADVRTWLSECFQSYCIEPSDGEHQLGYLDCALSLWTEMQLGDDKDKAMAELMNGLNATSRSTNLSRSVH